MKRLTLITVILGSALALVPVASAQVLSDGGSGTGNSAVIPSTQPTNVETQALVARGEALNARYGNAVTRLSPQEFRTLSQTMTPDELLGAVSRGEALNEQYTPSVTLRPDILGGNGGSSISPISTGSSYDWNTTIGATLVALLLAATAATLVTRRRHSLSF